MTSYVVVTGGVISSLGKGVAAASLALLVKRSGFSVDIVKIDPYLNIDAGTMRPTEHGEVFVTYDGKETDQDIGNYERFLSQKVSGLNNITSGQVFKAVLDAERALEYKGKCVQLMHHIPLEIERRIKSVDADVVFIEVGGTVGDYENIPFLESLRRMKLRGDNVCFVHVSYLPVPRSAGEMKSKPTQHSIKALSGQGIQADLLLCRASVPIDDVRREKIGLFCNVSSEKVISLPDASSIYSVPFTLEKEGALKQVFKVLGLKGKDLSLDDWSGFLEKKATKDVTIGLVGKYIETGDFELEDSYLSVVEAIKHASKHLGVNAILVWASSASELEGVDAIIVPGGFGTSGIDAKIDAIKFARKSNKPFLGLCLGLQLSVIEHARNVLGLKDATSVEFSNEGSHVVSTMPDQVKKIANLDFGGSMRLGEQKASLKDGLVKSLYGSEDVLERHRHRFEVNPDFVDTLEDKGLKFSGFNSDLGLVEFLERSDCDFFVATQAHPELVSSPLSPHPLFLGLIRASVLR